MEMPETRYARSGDVNIAYQVFGDGETPLVWVPGFAQHVELSWEEPNRRAWLEGLARFARVIVFDKRGTGLSDRVEGSPPLEVRMDDIRAVLDAAGVERAVVVVAGDSGPLGLLFAASHSDRTLGLVLCNAFANAIRKPDMPWLASPEEYASWVDESLLATVLFTDIVGSTAMAAELGDRRWRELLAEHHSRVRRELARFRGQEVDTAGDGFFATFDGPARAIRCACAITDSVGDLGIEIRAGLHTGECELVDGKVGGIAVHIGARVAAEAGAGEVLVSSTVKDLVAGSGLAFVARGDAELKGVPGEWRLYAVAR
jgi:class 3 adenylate cyclase